METENIASCYRKEFGVVQNTVEARLQPEGEAIGKVLCVNAKACIEDVEVLNGEARYNGYVHFCVLYLDENGKHQYIHDKVDLSGKLEDATLSPLMKPIYKVEVVEVSTKNASSNEVVVVATTEFLLDCIVIEQVDKISVKNDAIKLKEEYLKYLALVDYGTTNFNISEQFDVKANLENVLYSTAHANIKSISAGTGYFTVEGEIFVNSLVQVSNEEGTEFKNLLETISFKEELESENISKEDIIEAFAFVKPDDIKVTIVPNSEGVNCILNAEALVTVKYAALREQDATIYTDAYCTTNKTNLISESFTLNKHMRNECYNSNLEGSLTIGEDESRIAKITGVCGERLTVARTVVSNGEILVEGVAYVTGIYLTDDDVPVTESVQVEVPFSVKFNCSDLLETDSVFTCASIKDVHVKARKGKEIIVEFEVNFLFNIYANQTGICLKDVELTEELIPSEYALQIYLGSPNESLWDISKKLMISEELILEQNPLVVFPLEKQESIVYFRQASK